MNHAEIEVIILNDHSSMVGGAESVAIASAIGLAASGTSVTFFSCSGPIDPSLIGVKNLSVVCTEQDTIATNRNRALALYQGIRNTVAISRLRQVLATKSPDKTVVHVHSWSKALSPFMLDLVVEMGFRLIITLHDFFIVCPNGSFSILKTAELCGRSPLSLSCYLCNCDRRNYGHKLWRALRTTIQNRWLRIPSKTAYFIGVSDFSLKIAASFLPKFTPRRTVRHPVFAKNHGPVSVGENKYFIFIGRFSEEKGIRVFAKAVQKTGLPAMFIGDGPLMAEIREICPHGIFTGWLSPEAIHSHLRAARALVFPSLCYETLGLTAIESMAAGVPVILADHCAATDYIKHDRHGLHFRRGDVDDLSRQMMRVQSDQAATVQWGLASYQWYWNDPWTSERHVHELLEIYNEVCRLPQIAISACCASKFIQ